MDALWSVTKSMTKLTQRHSVWTSYWASYPALPIYDEIWVFVMDVVWSVTKSENIMGISSWIKGFLVVFFSFFLRPCCCLCDHAVAGWPRSDLHRAHTHARVGLFSSQVFFPSPHAPVGWVRGMIFFLILLASRPQQYNPIGFAYFSFFKSACEFNYIIIKSFSATKKI
jgi:hypothetical protein